VEAPQPENKFKDRAYDPALFGDFKELSTCDLIMIELKHYQAKFVNTACFKRFEKTGCYKKTARRYKIVRKALKKKVQGEFYVDSDPDEK
jgi:hypothetical protein